MSIVAIISDFRKDDSDQALFHLKKALTYESSFDPLINNTISTIVNLCTLLSKTGEHRQALEYAELAVRKMDAHLDGAQLMIQGKPASYNMVATCVIAYYNAAAESEHLRMWTKA